MFDQLSCPLGNVYLHNAVNNINNLLHISHTFQHNIENCILNAFATSNQNQQDGMIHKTMKLFAE